MARESINKINRNHILLLGRVFLAVIFIYLLAQLIPIEEVLPALKDADITWFILTHISGYSVIFIQAARWKTLINSDHGPSYWKFLKHTAYGYSANLILPSSMGGDVVKSISMGRVMNSITHSASSIFIGRVMGISSSCLLFFIGLSLHSDLFNDFHFFTLAMSLIFIAGMITLYITLSSSIYVRSLIQLLPSSRLSSFLINLDLREINHRAVIKAFAFSLLLQSVMIFHGWGMTQTVKMPIEFTQFLLFSPVMSLSNLIPISISNIGVREGVYIFFLTTLPGITKITCVSTHIIGYSVSIALAAIGLCGLLLGKSDHKYLALNQEEANESVS